MCDLTAARPTHLQHVMCDKTLTKSQISCCTIAYNISLCCHPKLSCMYCNCISCTVLPGTKRIALRQPVTSFFGFTSVPTSTEFCRAESNQVWFAQLQLIFSYKDSSGAQTEAAFVRWYVHNTQEPAVTCKGPEITLAKA